MDGGDEYARREGETARAWRARGVVYAAPAAKRIADHLRAAEAATTPLERCKDAYLKLTYEERGQFIHWLTHRDQAEDRPAPRKGRKRRGAS
jgi:hypothetical protein